MDIYQIKKGTPGCFKVVMQLQELLNKHLFPSPNLTVDGIFGKMTHDAVVLFQMTQKFELTGVVDPKTWNALNLPLPTPGTAESKVHAALGSGSGSGLDIATAIKTLNANAQPTFTGECSYYVAVAINSGLPKGVAPLITQVVTNAQGKVSRLGPTDGGRMGQLLTEKLNFTVVSADGYKPQTGDVAVTPPFSGDTRGKFGTGYGHVAMWNGQEWVSDAKQGAKPQGYSETYTQKDVDRNTLPKGKKVGEKRVYLKPVEYYRP